MEDISEIGDAATVSRDGRHIEAFRSLEGVMQDPLKRRRTGS